MVIIYDNMCIDKITNLFILLHKQIHLQDFLKGGFVAFKKVVYSDFDSNFGVSM